MAQLEFVPAGMIAVGLIPGIGDAASAAGKIARILPTLSGAEADAARRLLRDYADDAAGFIAEIRRIEPGLLETLRARGVGDEALSRILVSNSFKNLKEVLASPRLLPKPSYVVSPEFMLTGKNGEEFLKGFVGVPNYKHQRQPAPGGAGGAGGSRYPDAIVVSADGTKSLHEAKVGYVRGQFAKSQVEKDAALVSAADATDAT